MNINFNNKKLILLPATITCIISLLLVYKFTFPISWDVYYHIHMANLYMTNGLVFWDYSTVAPHGRLIMYPPLFHLFLATISNITHISLVNITRFLQPVFAFFVIYIISYSSYRLYSIKHGVITGFLGMLSFVTFNRSVICTPATIAIALSMIVCVLFFIGFRDNNKKDILLSAIFLGLICNLHMATSIMTIGVVGLYGLIQLVRKQLNSKYLLIYIIISMIIALPWWLYILINYGLFFNSIAGNPLFIGVYFYKYYGIIPLLFTIIGFYTLYKNKSNKSLFLVVWSLSLVLLSQVTYLGIETVSIRILEVASYPLILISGVGFIEVCNYIKNKNMKKLLVILLVMFSVLSVVAYVDSYTPDVLADNDYNTTLIPTEMHMVIDPIGTISKPSIISSRFSDATLAHDRYHVMSWFVNNSDGSLLVSEDSVMDTIVVSTSNTPVVYGGFTESIPVYVVDPIHIIENHSTESELSDLGVGYILLKHDTPIPIYAQNIYSNSNYKICIIKDSYRK